MQFTKGINLAGGLWETIKNIADSLQANVQFKALFTYNLCAIKSAQLTELIQIMWSEEGRNKQYAQDATVYSWEICPQSFIVRH